MTIRTPIDQITQSGRATQGVKIMDIKDNQTVMTITLLPHEDEEEVVEENPELGDTPIVEEAQVIEKNDNSDELF